MGQNYPSVGPEYTEMTQVTSQIIMVKMNFK